METMTAAVLRKTSQPLNVESGISIPQLRPGQVLVKIAFSGVCRSQIMEVKGLRGEDPWLPHLLGHEASGVVVDIGPDVTKVKRGGKVVIGWLKGRGIDAGGSVYRRGDERINAGAVTTFSEYSVVSENRVVPLPEGVPMDVAALFGCAVLTGAGMVNNTARPMKGSNIAVFGMGGVGLSALMAARLHHSASVIAIDNSPERLALARELGVTHCLDLDATHAVSEIQNLTEGKGVDIAIEATGSARSIEAAFASVRRGGGRCIFASHPANHETIKIDPYELICGKQIEGSWGGASDPDRDIPALAESYRKGWLPLEKLITKRYKLNQINEALADLECQRAIRPLVELDGQIGSLVHD